MSSMTTKASCNSKKRRHSKWSVFEGTEKNRTGPLSASVSLPLTSARYLPVHSNRRLILFRLPFSKQGKIIFIFRVRHDPGLTGTIREALHHLNKGKNNWENICIEWMFMQQKWDTSDKSMTCPKQHSKKSADYYIAIIFWLSEWVSLTIYDLNTGICVKTDFEILWQHYNQLPTD